MGRKAVSGACEGPGGHPGEPSPPPPPVLALDAKQCAAAVGVARSSWIKWNEAGLTPEPIRLNGTTPRWGRRELAAWIDHGGPPRRRWGMIWEDIRDKRPGCRGMEE